MISAAASLAVGYCFANMDKYFRSASCIPVPPNHLFLFPCVSYTSFFPEASANSFARFSFATDNISLIRFS